MWRRPSTPPRSSALITGGAWFVVDRQAFSAAQPNEQLSLERLLIFMAVLLLSAIVGWALVFCAGRKSANTLLTPDN